MFQGLTRQAFGLIAIISVSACTSVGELRPVTQASPRLITLDEASLSLSRERLQAKDERLKPAFDALISRADAALKAPAYSVTHKTSTPPSGDKRDYMSMGPYWWPNPDTPNKLPYVKRDGQRNPETSGNGMDSGRVNAMNAAVLNLSLAYYFSGNKAYASKAAELIRVWFLDEATRMAPHMRYAQAIPGVVDGRGIGLIDSRNFWMVIDGAALIAPSGELDSTSVQGLRQWFAQFNDWMLNSETGHEEDVWHNNHGMFYDAQVINHLLFIGDVTAAAKRTFDAQTRRIASQIARDGRQHMELERTRPFHYSVFNLEAAMRIARYGEQVNVGGATLKSDDPRCVHPQFRCAIDVWKFEVDERSLKRGIDFVTEATANPNAWRLLTKEESKLNFSPMVSTLLQAERAYKTGRYAQVLESLPATTRSELAHLLWPVR